MLSKGDKVYRVHASYGNINGAKAYIKRNQEKHREVGEELEYFRHEGKYYVGVKVADTKPPPEPPTPKPKGSVRKLSDVPIPGVRAMGGTPFHEEDLEDRFKINPGVVELGLSADGMHGSGTDIQKEHVSKIFGMLPTEHQAQIWSARVDSGRVVEGYKGATGRPPVGYIDGASNIVIAGERATMSRAKTVAHEAAHVVLGDKPSVRRTSDEFVRNKIATKSALTELIDVRRSIAGVKQIGTGRYLSDTDASKITGVSKYAKGSAGEFIAESYGYYVTQPSVLKRKDPEAYAILRDTLFDGQEYTDLSAD